MSEIYALGAIVVVVIVSAVALFLAGRATPSGSPATEPGRVALVYNPSKPHDWNSLLAYFTEAVRAAELPEPLIYETTADDPGVGQSRRALSEGAELVIAAGGDGTVRAVAEALASSGTPMAIIPSGTGNLFARNIDLPIDDPTTAIDIALAGIDRTVDIGWLRDEEPDAETREHLFLVVAGIGFDGEMVAETDDGLKKTIGWFAYGVGAIKGMLRPRMRTSVTIDDAPEPLRRMARSVMIANCGWLPAGLALQPEAEVDDGWLDLVTVDARGGLFGWASLGGKLVLRTFGFRGEDIAVASTLEYDRGHTFRIVTDHTSWVQVDGDLVSESSAISARIDPGALIVRVPSH